jgi:hypothetical protein
MYCNELYQTELYNHEIIIPYSNDEVIIIDTPISDTPLSDFLKQTGVTNLFAILVGMGTMISLLPVFLGFILGSDWLQKLFKTFFGYTTFLLILIGVFLGLIFMIFMLGYILIEFYKSVIKQNYSRADKFSSSIIIVCCLSSFFVICLVLMQVWVIKATSTPDYISSFTLLFLSLTIGLIFILNGIVVLVNSPQNVNLSTILNNFLNKIKRKWLRWVVGFVLICVLVFLLWTLLSPPAFLILNYYNDTNKNIDIGLSYNESLGNNVPTILHIRQTATKADNIGVDLSYFDCRWSTNFGHFVEVNSNNSEIIVHQQEVVFSGLPKCPLIEDNVYWTYDLSEYGKNKPNVLIGFTIKDSNKGTLLGSNYLNFTWKDKDYLEQINTTNISTQPTEIK